MRKPLLALLICLAAACGQPNRGEDSNVAKPTPPAFDGALVSTVSAKVAHGQRIVDVLGCKGCHGKKLEGKRFYELYGSNLTRDVPKYDDSQLTELLREGRRIDGRDVWGMPSEVFQHLSEPDMDALISYLRTLEPVGEPDQPHLPFEEETKQLIAQGKLKPAAQTVIDFKKSTPVDLGQPHALGLYLTMVTCAECHGSRLEGGSDTPDLIVASGYSRDEFEALMTKGVPNGPRKLKLMAAVGKNRFSQMTKSERDAIYAYLKARAEQPQ